MDASEHQANPPTYRFDAFISYSSVDRKAVQRIQHFLQSYTLPRSAPGANPRLRIYLDQTDIRGGVLSDELGVALDESRALVVCCSPSAATSDWVTHEVQRFIERRKAPVIAPVLLAGDPQDVIPEGARSVSARFHDLRDGWRFGLLRTRARDELCRLLALLTGRDLRDFIDWYKRRRRRRIVAASAVIAIAIAAVLVFPVDDWEAKTLMGRDQQPIAAIACEWRDGHLWLASRFKRPGPQGFRNYIEVHEDSLGKPELAAYPGRYRLSSRLLPLDLVDFGVEKAAKAAFGETWAEITRVQPVAGASVWLAEAGPGRYIAVSVRPPSEEKRQQAEELFSDYQVRRDPLGSALVAVFDNGTSRQSIVDELHPAWPRRDAQGDPPSPALGMPIAWGAEGQLWIGVTSRPDGERGGLWRSRDGGANWQRIEGFSSVHSLALAQGNREPLIVSERYHEAWEKGTWRVRHPSRVVQSGDGGGFSPADAPPFGSESEVDFCGRDADGHLWVRVDQSVYGHRTVPWGLRFVPPT